MDFLLREVTTDQGQVIYQDTELAADAITIGRSGTQLIQLRGGSIQPKHAVIKMLEGQLIIAGVDKNSVTVNGELCKSSPLQAGDEISLESHRIKIVRPPAGFDFACELFVDDELQDQALESVYRTSLADTGLGKRLPSYLLALLVVVTVLVWPLSGYLMRDNPVDATGQQQYTKQGAGDKLWSSGPLLPAHQLEVGDDCSACHKVPFQTVQDEACLDCHQGVADHFDYSVGQGHGGELAKLHIDMGVTECQSCHKEHNEPGVMVVSADSLCVDCHNEPLRLSERTNGTEAVTGFEQDQHPGFKLNYLLPKVVKKGTGVGVEWYSQYQEAGSGQMDLSNLKFPHDVHLDPDKVQTPGSAAGMVCGDCHTLKSDKEHFEDITMERHCSACHDLTFDVADPERELPHGNPRTVIQTIEEHFVRVYTDPGYKPLGSERRRRLPGQTSSAERCEGKPFDCGMQRATIEAGIQFTQRGCITCHEVSDNNSDDMYTRWMVLPVKINHDWYGRALFDHASHLTQRGKTDNAVCSSCHDAGQSATSTDVLIPDIDNCLSCHGDVSVQEKVMVNCISCHAFHPSNPFDPTITTMQEAAQ